MDRAEVDVALEALRYLRDHLVELADGFVVLAGVGEVGPFLERRLDPFDARRFLLRLVGAHLSAAAAAGLQREVHFLGFDPQPDVEALGQAVLFGGDRVIAWGQSDLPPLTLGIAPRFHLSVRFDRKHGDLGVADRLVLAVDDFPLELSRLSDGRYRPHGQQEHERARHDGASDAQTLHGKPP